MSNLDPSHTSTSSTEAMETNDTEEERRRKQIEENQPMIRLLQSWREEADAQRQKEAWEFIRRALDENRLSYRKFFPDDD